MAKHRAPAQIEIATTVERTWLHDAVERYWKTAVLAAVVFTVVLLWRQNRDQASREGLEEGWDRLTSELTFSSPMFFGSGTFESKAPSVLALLAEDLGDTPAAAWAKVVEIGRYVEDEDYEEAQRVLGELSAEWPKNPVASQRLFPSASGELVTLAEHIRERTASMAAWKAANPLLFQNPAPPSDAPKVRLKTERGDIVVALYSDRAPLHTENFLERCREKYYDGTRFHRVLPSKMIQGGDPNTIAGEEDTWGQGGPEETIPPEIDPELKHFQGVLAAAKKSGATNSSGSQFYIVTEPNHAWDGNYTVFGVVVEGLSVVEAIASEPVTGDRPETPVVLQSTEVL